MEKAEWVAMPKREREVVLTLTSLALLVKKGEFEPAVVTLGPWSAWVLVGALQLAWRNPAMPPKQRAVLEQLARPVQTCFSGLLAEVLEEGWDTSKDVPPEQSGDGVAKAPGSPISKG
jgi:hypothetical protein